MTYINPKHCYIHIQLTCIGVVFFLSIIYEYLSSLRTLYFKLQNITPVDNIYTYMTWKKEMNRSTNLASIHKWNEDIQPYIKLKRFILR